MPRTEFFRSFGLFFRPEFLDSALCDELRRQMASAPGRPAEVLKTTGSVVDEKWRRTVTADGSDAIKSVVVSRLEQLRPDLERHFDTPLSGCQPLKLLRYTAGDFFHAHADNGSDEVAARRVSAVVFLNDQTDDAETGSYSGGSLTFFGLVGGERGERVGFPLVGEKGLLVAFPAGMRHSVTPVSRGERFTIVTWFS
jgi:SM-20-related protein